MILLLPALIAGCDRQSPPKEQANAITSDEVQPASDRAKTGSTFDYSIDRSKAGTPAPDFAFADPDGGDRTLADFAGRPIVVNLWATWCAPCVAEMPTLDRLAAASGKTGPVVLTISQDTQGMAAVRPFFAKHALPHLTAYADPDNHFGFHYATGQLPTTVLYDRDAREIARVVGAMDWESQEGKDLIAEATAP